MVLPDGILLKHVRRHPMVAPNDWPIVADAPPLIQHFSFVKEDGQPTSMAMLVKISLYLF